ncbi:putative glycosyl hydrolases family 43 protein 2 [Elsinoe fawcettii]|nr:putative glycosyl hydrolases family 43 protein 2 [Elsinoe fawcettii]
MTAYNNMCMSVTKVSTPDPHVTYANNQFYLTFTSGGHVEIWRAKSLPDFFDRPDKHVIWRPPHGTDHSADLWAPELHALRGRWYVYYAAANPHHGNKSHRMYVLGGPPAHEDPATGRWEFLGGIRGMPPNQWAIDGTIIELYHQLYFVYSGWPFDNHDNSEKTQEIFIIRLSDPLTADSPAICLCQPHEPWERSGDAGINEGPQFLAAQDGSWVGIVYSCAGSWTNEYKMNTIQYLGGDPLNHASWRKGRQPLITNNNRGAGPWGPGHGSFIHIGNETVGIFHATDSPTDGWNNRRARMQRVIFKDGQPFMGGKVGPLTRNYDEFVGGSAGFASTIGNLQHMDFNQVSIGGLLKKVKNKIKQEL